MMIFMSTASCSDHGAAVADTLRWSQSLFFCFLFPGLKYRRWLLADHVVTVPQFLELLAAICSFRPVSKLTELMRKWEWMCSRSVWVQPGLWLSSLVLGQLQRNRVTDRLLRLSGKLCTM